MENSDQSELPETAASQNGAATNQAITDAGPIDIRNTALTVLAVFAGLYIAYWMQAILIPLVISLLISYGLYPIVHSAHKIGIPRPLSAAVLLCMILAALGYASYPLADQTSALLDKIPKAVRHIATQARIERYGTEENMIEKVSQAAKEIQKAADEAAVQQEPEPQNVTKVTIEEKPFDVQDYLLSSSVSVLIMLGQVTTILVLVYFFMVFGHLYKRKLIKLAGPRLRKRRIMWQILDDFNAQIRRFLFVMLLSSLFVGLLTWLVFLYIGLEQAALWGVIAGLGVFMPYLGPLIVFVATGIVALAQFENSSLALMTAFSSLLITSIQGWFLTPWLASRAVQINAVVVFIGILFWGFLWGPIGLLLATPILIILKVCCDHIENLQPIGELLGS